MGAQQFLFQRGFDAFEFIAQRGEQICRAAHRVLFRNGFDFGSSIN